MARKKVTLAWIAHDATRRTTMRKRRKGLMKKVSELSTLCGVEACAVVYAPDESRPEVWPSEMEAKVTLLKYKAMPETEQCKKRMDQAGFFGQGITKLEQQIRKQRGENWELELNVLLDEALAGKRSLMGLERIEDTVALDRIIGAKMEDVKQRVAAMKAAAAASNPSSSTVPCPNPNPNPNVNPTVGMELGFWNGVGPTKATVPASNQSSNTFPNPSQTPCEGMDLVFWNGSTAMKKAVAAAASSASSSTVPNPNPNPNPSEGLLGFWNCNDHHYQGFGGLEEVLYKGSSSWADMSIFKCHPY